jgi:hypothetical protein
MQVMYEWMYKCWALMIRPLHRDLKWSVVLTMQMIQTDYDKASDKQGVRYWSSIVSASPSTLTYSFLEVPPMLMSRNQSVLTWGNAEAAKSMLMLPSISYHQLSEGVGEDVQDWRME